MQFLLSSVPFTPAHLNRQLLMFSATMSRKVERLASDALTSPIRITVGETGTANEDISQVGRAVTVACAVCHSICKGKRKRA